MEKCPVKSLFPEDQKLALEVNFIKIKKMKLNENFIGFQFSLLNSIVAVFFYDDALGYGDPEKIQLFPYKN